MRFPMLPGEYYDERRGLATGALHMLMDFPLPDGAYLAGWDYTFTINSSEDMKADEFTAYELGFVWIPVYGSDQSATFNTDQESLDYFQRMMPNVDETEPTASWTPTRSDLQLGQLPADSNALVEGRQTGIGDLLWQPDLFSLRFLTNPGQPAVLWKLREKIGYVRGTGYRTGSGTSTRAQRFITGRERSGLMCQHPGVLYFYCNIPQDIDDNRYDDRDSINPIDRQYENLRFLAPDIQMLSALPSTWPADEDDYRRWAKIYRTTGDRQWKQYPIDISFELHWHFARNPRALTLTPQLTTSQQADPPSS